MKTAWTLLATVTCGMMTISTAPTASAGEEVAWLGCRIGPVPGSLNAHLALAGGGAMVLNVAKDSPADNARLERYDVIVQVGSDRIDSPDQLIERVRKHRPRDKVTLQVIHEGRKNPVEVTLAARPKTPGAEQYKYERWPDAFLDDRIGVRGRIFRRGPDGWIIEDLGELKDVPRLFHDMVPRLRRKQGRFWFEKDEGPIEKFQARVSHEGQVIEVEGDVDGPITVRRTRRKDDAKKVRSRTYKTPADLKKSDPEAYKIYTEATDERQEDKTGPRERRLLRRRGVGRRPFVDRYRRWLGDLYDKLPDRDDLPDRERLHDRLDREYKALSRELTEKLDALREQRGDLEKHIEEQLERLRRRLASPEGPAPTTQESPGPTTRFEVAADGKITVHLRRDDSELTLEFKNADELKAKRPDLFKKFESLNNKP